MQPIQGLHHITAVAKDPQANVDFYRQVLGQRLVKTTVNFDDPGTYHFYYGDEVGTPGTILTFFPWQHVAPGRVGPGETSAAAYGIRAAALPFWRAHLARHGVPILSDEVRFGRPVIGFADPGGMRVELAVTDGPATFRFWADGPIPQEHALLGFHGVTLLLDEAEPTAVLLTDHLGYAQTAAEGRRTRFTAAGNDLGAYIDIVTQPGSSRGRFGAGSIHHIAFRTVDDAEQLAYQQQLLQAGYRVTPVQDRQYFRSIYFRSPGGVLFEIATDAPGFLADESLAELGGSLKLPAWYEPQRAHIEAALPPFTRKPLLPAEVPHAG